MTVHMITYKPILRMLRMEPDWEDATICGIPKPFGGKFNLIGGTVSELEDGMAKEPCICKNCAERFILMQLDHYL